MVIRSVCSCINDALMRDCAGMVTYWMMVKKAGVALAVAEGRAASEARAVAEVRAASDVRAV